MPLMFSYIDKDRKRLGQFFPWVSFVNAEEDELGFNRIEIRCASSNQRSCGVPLACKYLLEGVLRQECIENGEYRDTHVYAKIKDDI